MPTSDFSKGGWWRMIELIELITIRNAQKYCGLNILVSIAFPLCMDIFLLRGKIFNIM